MKRSVLFGVILFIAWFLLFIIINGWAATDVEVSRFDCQVGDRLPIPYDCLSYQGHNGAVLTLWPLACDNKTANWLYVQANNQGDFVFEWDTDTLVLRPIGPGRNQVHIYRRIP